jgi:invasion protein IalB
MLHRCCNHDTVTVAAQAHAAGVRNPAELDGGAGNLLTAPAMDLDFPMSRIRAMRLFLSAALCIGAAVPAAAQAEQTPPAVAPAPAPAAPAEAAAASPSPWSVVCPKEGEAAETDAADEEGKGVCVMTQRLSAKPDGPRVLQVFVRRLSAAEQKVVQREGAADPIDRMRIDLPFGLDLTAGVELRVDGEEWTKAPFRTCLSGGCVTFVLLDEEAVSRLKRGGRMGVLVKALNGRPLAWPVSLAGFTAAYAELEAAAQ